MNWIKLCRVCCISEGGTHDYGQSFVFRFTIWITCIWTKGTECSAVQISTPCMDIKVSLLLKTIIGYYIALTYEDGWELCFIDGVLAHISVLNVSPPLDNWHKCEHLKTYTLCFVTWICQNYIFNSIWIKISQYLRMVCVYCIHVK